MGTFLKHLTTFFVLWFSSNTGNQMLASIARSALLLLNGVLFEYKTPRIITIRSVKIGLLHRFLQLAIVGFIVGYAIIYNKGYQEKDVGHSTVVTKVKGLSSSTTRFDLPRFYRRIWDTTDYVYPALMTDAVFIATNFIITPNQHYTECPENSDDGREARCTSNRDCTAGRLLNNGEMTGLCVASNVSLVKTCQIKAWCPIENDKMKRSFRLPLIKDVDKFSILVKNTIEFTKFNEKYRNVDLLPPNYDLKSCLYDEHKDPRCPKFLIGDIVRKSGANFTRLSIFGGVINVFIQWHCNLDYSITKCIPKFKFSYTEKSSNEISPGFNFRYANYYRNGSGVLFRDLIKTYGILVVFKVEALAGRFGLASLALNVGAGLALLGLAQLLIDMILIYVYKEKHSFRQHKFLTISLKHINRQNKRYAKNASKRLYNRV